MILVTASEVAGHRVVRTLGLVRGNSVRVRHIGRDIMAEMKNLVGGEVHEYTKLMAEAREQSLDRMAAEAEQLGANAVIAIRFTTSEVMRHASEILVYGTAVILEPAT
ncbi:MAG TPA: YbjQ family protein [Candidatus Saccharimonadales bacterium]|nr:YbjQ family protein [Candidatus Saccharimonadales bacterium]